MSKNAHSARSDQTQKGQQEQILKVENLRKTFGGITAVADVSFHVEKGSITGLIGPNGAGKSTTFDLITGVQRPDGGEVEFNDTEITGYRSDQVANQGLVRTFQIARELSEMTVLENLLLAPQNQAGEAVWRAVLPRARTKVVEQEKELREQAWEMLELFEIEHVAHESAGNLSGGQRKLLEMARVLMTDPRWCCWTNRLRESIRHSRRNSSTGCTRSKSVATLSSSSNTTWTLS